MTYSDAPLAAKERFVVLERIGVYHSRRARRALGAARDSLEDFEAKDSKYDTWQCILCTYTIPKGTYDPPNVVRAHFRSHGTPGLEVLR